MTFFRSAIFSYFFVLPPPGQSALCRCIYTYILFFFLLPPVQSPCWSIVFFSFLRDRAPVEAYFGAESLFEMICALVVFYSPRGKATVATLLVSFVLSRPCRNGLLFVLHPRGRAPLVEMFILLGIHFSAPPGTALVEMWSFCFFLPRGRAPLVEMFFLFFFPCSPRGRAPVEALFSFRSPGTALVEAYFGFRVSG